MTKNLVVIIRI